MANPERKIKPELKKLLIEKAGNKCANPGCSNWRVHIHHIKHWAIYKAHDSASMIAICPSCHDQVHHGNLKISDDTLYAWKNIARSIVPDVAHIYIEPSTELRIVTGTICLKTENDQAVVFKLSNYNQLSFRILDNDILQVNVKLHDSEGEEILRVVENHVRVVRHKLLNFSYRAGMVQITVPNNELFVPAWIVNQMRNYDPSYGISGSIIALEMEVIRPGVIRIRGCWPDISTGVVITDTALSFCRRDLIRPISLVGEGESSVLKFTGPVTRALFNL